MSDIRISPTALGALVVAVVAAVGAVVVTQLPELQRYLKIRSM